MVQAICNKCCKGNGNCITKWSWEFVEHCY